jgi:hypothetical protein
MACSAAMMSASRFLSTASACPTPGCVRVIMADVEGKILVVDVFASADKFAEFLPSAQKLLNLLEWKNASASQAGRKPQ